MKSILDKEFRYTPVSLQGPDYLRARMSFYRQKYQPAKPEKVVGEIRPKAKAKA